LILAPPEDPLNVSILFIGLETPKLFEAELFIFGLKTSG